MLSLEPPGCHPYVTLCYDSDPLPGGPKLKLLRTLIASLLAVIFVAGCGGSKNEEVAEALAGTWNATSVVFTNKANSSETFDLLAAGGSANVTFTAAGEFSGSFTDSGGTFVVEGTNLIITNTGESDSETIAFTLSGNTLTLTVDDEFDFDEDGVDESASLIIVFQKNGTEVP